MEPLTAAGLALAILAVAVGAVVQGTAGFGLALVSVPLLILVDPRLVPGPITVATPILSVLVLVRDHHHGKASPLRWPVLGLVPGAAAGAVAVALLPVDGLAVLGAVLVLVGVAASVVGPEVPATRATLAVAGLVSGFMGTTAGLNGPPMALLHQRATGPALRVTMARFFLAAGVVTAAALVAAGHLGWWEVAVGAALVPGVLVGFAASRWLVPHADRGFTRPLVLLIAGSSAVAVLVRTLVAG